MFLPISDFRQTRHALVCSGENQMSLLRYVRFATILLYVTLGYAPPYYGQITGRETSYLSYKEAQPVLNALADVLPPELKGKTDGEQASAWARWVRRSDNEIRARLAQGDEDSFINLLLFGTSFTNQARITPRQIEQFGKNTDASGNSKDAMLEAILRARINDFLNALNSSTQNERLSFARQVLIERKGLRLETKVARAQAEAFLLSSLARVLKENASYAQILKSAQLLGDPNELFITRSKLFSNRGLSSDTSLLPNFALEQSLKQIRDKGLLEKNSVRRVAIIGPGLDFTDKQEGYDFYSQQTIQPFAIIDSLIRLGLADAETIEMTTLDLSPRINAHIARAKQLARSGQSYIVQLPRDTQLKWQPEAVRYWESFGDQIGKPIAPVPIPTNLGDLKLRAMSIRPSVVARVTPLDVNIVVQHLNLAPNERFDLIIATNILVYYDTFQQSLALLNIEKMLRPKGFLLSNNALLELPISRVHSVGYAGVAYSDRPDDGDFIVWYQNAPAN